MLNVEIKDIENLKGKRMLYSLMPWRESETGLKTSRSKKLGVRSYKSKIKGKAVVISCDRSQYITIPKLGKSGIQHTGSSMDNTYNPETEIYKYKPEKMYIDLSIDLVDFKNEKEAKECFNNLKNN
jgi:hypothetical protein